MPGMVLMTIFCLVLSSSGAFNEICCDKKKAACVLRDYIRRKQLPVQYVNLTQRDMFKPSQGMTSK